MPQGLNVGAGEDHQVRRPEEHRREIAKAVAWTAVQKWSVRLGGFAVLVALSRLVRAEDLGLVALASAITGIFAVVAELGTTTYILQSPALGEEQLSTVFWTHLVLCVVTALVVVSLAEPVAAVLHEPSSAPVVRVLAVALPLSGLGGTPTALLTRQLRARQLAVKDTIAMLVGSVAGISVALMGMRVWALVVQTIVQSFVGVAIVWRMVRWRPVAAFSPGEALTIVRFGGAMSATQLVSAVNERAEQLLLGAIGGTGLLGYWSIGTRLLNLLHDVTLAVLDPVALPVLARARTDAALFRRTLEVASAGGLLFLAPVLTGVASISGWLIPAVFGAGWVPMVGPVRILCVGHAVGGLIWFTRPAMLARGRVGVELALTVAGLLVHIAAIVVGAPHGIVALAWAVAAEAIVMIVVRLVVQRAVLDIPWVVYATSARVLVAVAGMVVTAAGAHLAVGSHDAANSLLVTGLSGIAYVVLLRLLCPDLLQEVMADLRSVVGR